jgi:diacylglycerol kinase family enzyme
VEVHAGRASVAAIARICRAKACDAIVVGGGDGTVSAAASAAAESGIALGVLPLGTMNLFARSLGIPLDMRAAAEALAGGGTEAVDIGVVNGRHFVHHVTLGLHPRMIRIRERLRYGSRLGKLLATLQAWWVAVRQPPKLAVRIDADGEHLNRRTAAVLVTNNPLGEGHLPYADDLREGRLGLYVTTSRRWGDLLQLAAQLALGDTAGTPLMESRKARRIEIGLDHDVVNASVDGEVVSLSTPVKISVRAGGLTVLRPQAAPSSAAEDREPASGAGVSDTSKARELSMTEELTKTEARQGDRRRTNMTALVVGILGAVVLMGALLFFWA